MHRFSLVERRGGGCSLRWCRVFSSLWLLLLWSTRSRHMGLWPTSLTAPRHGESSQSQDQAPVHHICREIPNHWTIREVLLQNFFLLNSFIFNLRKTAILWVSAIHQHGSAIAIVTSPPLWRTFNLGILCSWSSPCRSGHTLPLSPWQDNRFCLFCHFLPLYERESVIHFKFRALRIVLVPQSCLTLCDPTGCKPPGSSVPGDSLGKNTGVGCHFLVQGIFPTEGSSSGLPHCRQILYHLSHQGSPTVDDMIQYFLPQFTLPLFCTDF